MDNIKALKEQIKENQAALAKLKREEAENIRRKHKVLWGIYATPSDKRHCSHQVPNCIFTTKESAEKQCIPSSHDYDDGVHWRYSVTPLEPGNSSY